ncbi:hypothetical protein E2C01_009999 [Portunus trituberculatus]|uniref:Uncharacterized protein n=1 Tax=Portunus trituberculatus TaxID=210409 RepID=A0A5B7D777_PORTR|nr:hypothetical protein [Portunus trituberculatus]
MLQRDDIQTREEEPEGRRGAGRSRGARVTVYSSASCCGVRVAVGRYSRKRSTFPRRPTPFEDPSTGSTPGTEGQQGRQRYFLIPRPEKNNPRMLSSPPHRLFAAFKPQPSPAASTRRTS